MFTKRPVRRGNSVDLANRRPLQFELLEDRRMLAVVTVDTLLDELDGSIGDGDVSLRDALAAVVAGDTIDFAPNLNGATINLTLGELAVTQSITIDATTLNSGVTVGRLGQ